MDNGSKRHVFIETFGCQMNENDTGRMLSFLKGNDYSPTDVPSEADLILVNTCSIRDKAEQKVYSALGRFKRLKDKNPALLIGVTGCVAQQKGSVLLEKAPYLDMVIGTHNIHNIPSVIKEVSGKKKRVSLTEFYEEIKAGEYSSAAKGGIKAYVNIMRGCDNFCTYCIVPYTRGGEVSRPAGDIIDEIKTLAGGGTKEVTLLGQNVNSYKGEVSFPELLRRAAGIGGVERVRFVTSHPKDISKELIYLYGEEPKICRSIHLPLQSGSDMVLERMKRGYTARGYLSKLELLKNLYPEISVTTDIIVGFPGEGGEDFKETMRCVREVEFDGIFSFKYSPRPMTAAAAFPDVVPPGIKQERLEELQALQKEITLEKNKALVGKTVKVLIEGQTKRNPVEVTGRTSCNRVVNLPSPRALAGCIADVFVVDA
ncbi:MAG: tRNA (N6-isopentenyl adenosine(37)-C2)-methylthiotransferase MiaB [Deltaproteobacteria bacterium]|nr:tRNA (N6-isopentenyl adenosine(37)-C2)-methylthiotransferase MiaB [Deltaproteobacteria bacterium]